MGVVEVANSTTPGPRQGTNLVLVAAAAQAAAKPTEPAVVDERTRVQDEVSLQYQGLASCVFRPPSEGGRVLVTTRKVKRGEVVASCQPQLVIGRDSITQEQQAIWDKIIHIFGSCSEDYWQVRMRELVWGALNSLTEEDLPSSGFPLPSVSWDTQRLIMSHFVPDVTPSSKMIQLHEALGLRCTPMKLERVVAMWECNSLVHSHRKSTHVLCLGFALMNHSCGPTVNWQFEGDAVALRAVTDLDPGAELSVSYMEDEDLLKSTAWRREHILHTGKRFTCGCPRCSGPELCRHVSCPDPACAGVVPLGPGSTDASAPCTSCGRILTVEEVNERVSQESALEKLLAKFRKPEEDSDSDDDESSDDDDEDRPPAKFFVDKIDADELKTIKEIATTGRWLAPKGHWLAYQSFGLLKDLAWSQKAGPAAVLSCLDQRASFARQVFPTDPPVESHGWELLEAAKLLLSCEDWPLEWSDVGKRQEAAHARLQECIAVLEPLCGPDEDAVVEARQLIATCGKAKRGKKREREVADDA